MTAGVLAWLHLSAGDPTPTPTAPPSVATAGEEATSAGAGTNPVPAAAVPAPGPAAPPVPSLPPTNRPSQTRATNETTGVPVPTVTTRPVPLRRPAGAAPPTMPPVPGPSTRPAGTAAASSAATPSATGATPPVPVAAPGSTAADSAAGTPVPPVAFGARDVAAAPTGEGGQAPIAPSEPSNGPVDMSSVVPAGALKLPALPLEQALMLYANLTGRTILRPSNLPPTPITLDTQTDLTRAEAIQALDSVLALNGITMVNIGDKFVTAVPSNQALQEAPAFATGPVEELPEASQYVTKLVTLQHAIPSEVAQLLQGFGKVQNGIVALDGSRTLVLRDYAANIKRMMEIIERVDTEQEMEYTLEVIPIKYGKVDEIYGTMSSLISGGGGVAGVGSTAGAGASGTSSRFGSTRSLRTGTSNQRFGSSSRMGSNLGGYSNPYQSGMYRPQELLGAEPAPLDVALNPEPGAYRPLQVSTGPATTRTGSTTFSQRLQQIVNRASGGQEEVELLQDARIVPDERSNSLIVFANREDMKMITNIVAKVDQLNAQVLIEAIIMDVQLSDELEMGVSSYLRSQSGNFSSDLLSNPGSLFSAVTNYASGNPSGLTWLGSYNDDLNVVVRALASTGKGQILATPRIQTSHAMEASFSVGESVPYVTGTFTGGGFVGQSQSFSQLDVATELLVIPYITPDGLVVMDISQHIEEITGFKKFEVGELPQTVTRDAQATVSVRDGDTIILGGYVRASRSRNNNGVPILKDLPLLGALFRSKSNRSSRSEMVVFIRPTVLTTPQEAAAFADSERKTMTGISQMERLMREDQDRLRERTERLDRKP